MLPHKIDKIFNEKLIAEIITWKTKGKAQKRPKDMQPVGTKER
jgi:hypothetical protein